MSYVDRNGDPIIPEAWYVVPANAIPQQARFDSEESPPRFYAHLVDGQELPIFKTDGERIFILVNRIKESEVQTHIEDLIEEASWYEKALAKTS